MNNYQDAFSRYHDKPVTDSNPYPCNNAFAYSAYAHKLGLPLDDKKLLQCWIECRRLDLRTGNYILSRNPGQATPPFSHDEVLGATHLGLLQQNHLNGWSYSPFPVPAFNLFKLIKQLGPLIKYRDYRNYFWQNNLDQIYRFAFKVRLVDREFMLKTWGKFQWFNPLHLFYSFVAKCDKLQKPVPKNGLRFLKYGIGKAEMAMEFPVDHPISIAANNK